MTKQEFNTFVMKIKETRDLYKKYKLSDSLSEKRKLYRQIIDAAEPFYGYMIENIPVTVTLKYNMDIILNFQEILSSESDDVLKAINDYIYNQICESYDISYKTRNISKEVKVDNQDSKNLIDILIK